MTAPLDEVADRLSDRDWQILDGISESRFLTTRQLARAFFDGAPTEAIPRRVNHALVRLKRFELLATLERRIGGVRAGSAGHVWRITDAGSRLLAAHDGASAPTRVRLHEPSTTFLDHTLAVAETALRVREAARLQQFTVTGLEREPAAWRRYLGPIGSVVQLKPDLALVTHSHGFEDRWFIEVDRDTEPPSRILTKCRSYEQYRATGIEQDTHGVFPAVLWVVPSGRRAAQLRDHIGNGPGIDPNVFAVITLAELDTVLRLGLATYKNNQGGKKGANPS